MGDEHHSRHPTPAELLGNLLEGNRRFRDGVRRERDLPGEVAAHRNAQRPPLAIVGCIDSRVAPELVFDLGIGEAFDIRLAGAIVDDAAGAVMLVVLGHTNCGAVKAACDVAAGVEGAGESLPNLGAVLEPIIEAVDAETLTASGRDSSNHEFVDRVAELNVHRTIMEIRERSDLLRGLADQEGLAIVGAMYDVRSGEVRLLD